MKFSSLLALALLCLHGAASARSLPVNREKVWFKPSLTVDSAPICAGILRVEQDAFFADGERARNGQDSYDLAGLDRIDLSWQASTDPSVDLIRDDDDAQWVLKRPGGQEVFVRFLNGGGRCVGGCESEELLVSDQRFERPASQSTLPFDHPGTPPALGWNLYKTADGEFHALGVMQGRLRAYRIAAPASVELACEVIRTPDELWNNKDPEIRRAWQELEPLLQAYGAIAQGDGLCGSGYVHAAGYSGIKEAMEEALYRPWATVPDARNASTDAESLGTWALGGVSEYKAWLKYRSQIERTSEDLAGFYGRKYSWPETEAKEQAARVVRSALDSGWSFHPEYDPARGERPLRQAILERQPLEVIKQIELGERANDEEDFVDHPEFDSVLNVAIEYPEALQYLLSKGLDPDSPNEFGKTPLMYAAQHNQIESARILLAAGADPNARTHPPLNTCYYTLDTSGMTPLHYATRYASAPLIRMLVAAGAATFNPTRQEYSEAAEYPLDWLKKYTGNAAVPESDMKAGRPEKNANIAAAELPALFDLLRVASEADRQGTSATLLARGQAEYARGDFNSAYGSLSLAVSADPTNEKALADMPLVALKAGRFQQAIAAAQRGIQSTSVPLQASAWFNMGLICERDDVRQQYFGRISCDGDWVWPFVQAWKLQPTRARADKLRQVFGRADAGWCYGSGEELKVWSVMTRNHLVERIHIFHQAGKSPDLLPAPGMTRVIDNLAVSERAITVIERAKQDSLPLINHRACRMPDADAAESQ